jgi:tetratricopeptide (TPR) repeat protein
MAAIDRWGIWAAAAIIAAAFVAYHNSLGGALVFDDIPAIRDNATVRTLWPPVAFAPPRDTGLGGRPLANFSFAISHALGGGDVRAHHAVNLLLHAGSALLLFGIVRRALGRGRPGIALAAALLWVVHPLATGSVTYLSQRTELLMAFCWLLTLYCFARGWLAASVIACAGGMMSKESMATAPLIVLLLDRTFVAGTFRAALRQRRVYYAGLAATWGILGYLLTTGLHQRSVGFGLGVSAVDYALTECRAVLLYLKLAVWPAPLVFDYGRAYEANAVTTVLCASLVLLLLGWTVRAVFRGGAAGCALGCFFLLLAPSSSFVPVAETPIAENRAYLPLAVVIVAAVAAWRAKAGWNPRAVLATGLGLAALTLARNLDYRSELALWTDTVAKRPQSARAHFNRGVALLDLGRAEPARQEFAQALQLNPRDPKAHNSLGNALLELGRPPEAIPHFAEAVAIEPNYPRAWFNYGTALFRNGRGSEAIARFERALALDPRLADAEDAIGNVYFQQDQPAQAIPHYEAALRIDPKLADAHYNCGSANLELGRIDAALAHFAAAVQLKPTDAEIRNHHGAALARAGRVTEAMAEFEAALRLKPDYTDARDNLALVRGEQKRSGGK